MTEIRNDEIGTVDSRRGWANLLAGILTGLMPERDGEKARPREVGHAALPAN